MDQNQILKKILILNLDEKRKTFNTLGRSGFTIKATSVESKINDINFDDYCIIIVCTQNSLSGNSKHFQQKFMDIITKEQKFTMLSKIDATRQVNRRSSLGFKGSNVRTRIYIRKEMVETHFNTKKFQYSYALKQYIGTNGRPSNEVKNKNGEFVKNGEAWVNKRSEKDLQNTSQITPNKINMTGLSIFRETDKINKKEGVIYVALKFEYPGLTYLSSNNKFYVIVKNMSNNFNHNINFENNLLKNIKTSKSTSTKFIVNSKNKSYNISNITLINLNSNVNSTVNVTSNVQVLKQIPNLDLDNNSTSQTHELTKVSTPNKKQSFLSKFFTKKVKPSNSTNEPLIQSIIKNNINSQFKSNLVQLQDIVGKIYGGQNFQVYNKFTKQKINQLNYISNDEKDFIGILLITICLYVLLKKMRINRLITTNYRRNPIVLNFQYVQKDVEALKENILNFNFNNKFNNTTNNMTNNTIKNDFLITLKHLVQLDVAKNNNIDLIINNIYDNNNTLKIILQEYKNFLNNPSEKINLLNTLMGHLQQTKNKYNEKLK